MATREEIREKQDKILNLVKAWAVIPHPYEGRDAESLLYVLSKEEGVVIKVDRELPPIHQDPFKYDDEAVTASIETQGIMLKAGYVAIEPLIEKVEDENSSTAKQ